MVTPHMTRYERVEIDGVRYMVCAECRRPHKPGYGVCYVVPQPGVPSPGASDGQSLCRDCYWAQWRRIYPGEPLPDIAENTPEWAEPIPWKGVDLTATTEEIAAQRKAIDLKQLEGLLAKRKMEAEETERMLRELRGDGQAEGELTVSYRE